MRQWPLVGRSAEMASVREALAQSGDTRGVAITGAAGVGKTRIAHEAEHLLQQQGYAVRWLVATAATQTLPLGVFSAVLGQAGGDSLQVAHEVSTTLGSGRPCALVVEDAHRLDELSAAVLLQLVAGQQIRAVVTIRAGEPVPETVSALIKDGYLEALRLEPLPVPVAAELISVGLDDALDPAVAARFAELSGGNPLYLRQIVLGEQRAARLVRRPDGAWDWPGTFQASPELAELVEQTALAVPAGPRDVLDLLAVVGDLALDVIIRCVDPGQVEAAEDAGLVTVEVGATQTLVRPAHPLYAEVRRARIGELTARRLRGIVADALQRADDQPTEQLRRASLLLDSDRDGKAGVYAEAAEQAIRLFDYPLGERLAEAAVEAGGGFDSGIVLAMAQMWCNHRDAATATCRRLIAESRDDVERLRASVISAGHIFFMDARPADGLAELERARSAISVPQIADLTEGLKAFLLACLAQPKEAMALAHRTLERPGVPPQMQMCALIALVAGLGLGGQIDAVDDYAEQAWTIGAASYDSANIRLGAIYLQICALIAAGRVREAVEVADRRSNAITPGLLTATMAGGFSGAAALAAGRIATSVDVLEHCCAAGRHDTSGWRYHASVLLARGYAQSGRIEPAVRTASLGDSIRHPGHLWFEPERLLTAAWVAAARGGITRATRRGRQADAWAAAHDQLHYRVLALHTLVRFGCTDVVDQLMRLRSQVDGPRVDAALDHARGVADAQPAALQSAAESLEAMGDLVAAADAYAQAATLLDEQGRIGSRAIMITKAAELQRRCGVITPALRVALRPLPMGPREREVATLAAYGDSNKIIAEQLQLSVRTVEGHLYRACGHLGLNSRTQLSRILCLGPDDLAN